MEEQQIPYTMYIVFGLTRPELEPTIYRSRGEQANHYTTEAVKLRTTFTDVLLVWLVDWLPNLSVFQLYRDVHYYCCSSNLHNVAVRLFHKRVIRPGLYIYIYIYTFILLHFIYVRVFNVTSHNVSAVPIYCGSENIDGGGGKRALIWRKLLTNICNVLTCIYRVYISQLVRYSRADCILTENCC